MSDKLEFMAKIIQDDLDQIFANNGESNGLLRNLIEGEFDFETTSQDEYVIITWEKLKDGNMYYMRTPITAEQLEKIKDKHFLASDEGKKIFERTESVLVALSDTIEAIVPLDTTAEDKNLN